MAAKTADETNAVAQYQAAMAEHTALGARLRELDEANMVRILTAAEITEATAIEKRLSGMQPQLEKLRKEAAYAEVADGVEDFAAAVDSDVPKVHQAFEALMASLAQTQAAFQDLCALVERADMRTWDLPTRMRERLGHPSVQEFQQNFAGRLGLDLRALSHITPQRRAEALDIVPNGRKANRVALHRFLEEHKVWMARESGR